MSTVDDLDTLLTPVITQAMLDTQSPGALVHVRVGSTPALHKAFGTRQLGPADPMTLQDHFRIGSNTKTMTGTVAFKLVENGRLDLDRPVRAYADGIPNTDDLKVRDLLDMQSGLENYSARRDFNRTLDQEPARAWKPEELVNLGVDLPPHAAPRTGFYYSNTNTIVLGLIAEDLTGKSLDQLFQEWIFDPLGLRETSLPARDVAAIPSPHPRGYMYMSNVETLGSAAIPPDERVEADAWRVKPGDRTNDNPSWTWAAGGAISTLGDLVTYVEALVKGGLIRDDLQKMRLDSLVSTNPSCTDAPSYGLALAKFGTYVGHDGTMPGFQSFMGHDRDTDTTVVVATNLTYSPDGRETANAIARAIMGALPAPPAD
jgi:D-alanyl-D-alanine carboxypeptidase